ncbi:MAG TPA: LLM class F420-dependent oxidoreductase [Burkholderiales bacterium]|nr:LLM class F420-dependent oxidoreductase [Burkholderiales bacterium]
MRITHRRPSIASALFVTEMNMKISAVLPFDDPDFQTQEDAVAKVATLLERVGFDSCSVTDHPCPTGRWLDAGGHHAQDPFVMLAMVAAVTRKLRLLTGILVLAYRNPFICARAVATLDVFSRGRVILGMGAGYLKGEYRALGVDFERRNELMDEYLRALKAAWGADEFTFQGTGYQALGNRILPRPVQKPHPPLWIGGNSKRAIRRAVELGDAWYPFFTAGPLSQTTRTAAITGEVELRENIAYMREYSEQVGRKHPPEVVVGSFILPGEWTASAVLDRLAQLQELGVSTAGVPIKGRTLAEWCDAAERYGVEIVPKLPKGRG